MTTKNELFTQIAREHLFIETLEQRNRDSLDFHDVGVVGVQRALDAAYRAGQAELLAAAEALLEAEIPVAGTLPAKTKAAFKALHQAVKNARV